MFGGPPPPSVPKHGKLSSALSKYVLALLHPWSTTTGKLPFSPTPRNLLRLCSEWNSTEASFVNKQRYRVMENIFQKHFRSSKNEKACSEWRNRNAEMWQDSGTRANQGIHGEADDPSESDPEARGTFSLEERELYEMTTAAAAKNQNTISAVRAMRASFWSLIPQSDNRAHRNRRLIDAVYQDHLSENVRLSKISRGIHAMTPPRKHNSNRSREPKRGQDVNDLLEGDTADETRRQQCSTDQRKVFDKIVGSIEGRGKLRQTLTVLHGGGGTGKSSLIRLVTETLNDHGIDTVCTCPTGVGAANLDGGRTVHSAFKVLKKDNLGPNDLELMRLTFTQRVWLIVVDEVSMLTAEQLALLDLWLRGINNTNVEFGGRSILLTGDFLQLDVTAGTSLCKMLHQTSPSSSRRDARGLFHKFTVCFLTQQHRAAGCQIQKASLTACRALPPFYSFGSRYTAKEKRLFSPVTPEIAATVTHELTANDIAQDPDWLDQMTILVTNNFDKAALTACAARLYSRRNGEILFRWRRQTKPDTPLELEGLVYDEDSQPELFAYFVKGVTAQILDNNNGNVGWSIANGTACKMHSLAWEDQAKNDLVLEMMEQARRTGDLEIQLPFPPDFVNVVLLEPSGDPRSGEHWPNEFNLDSTRVSSPDGTQSHKQPVIIPIGLMGSQTRKRKVHLGEGVLSNPFVVEYIQHAVDVALVMTVWKAQRSTLKRVILNLESTRATAPSWGFEHLYVGMSRVTAAKYLRCFPLTGAFRLSSIENLRPNIFTTRWRLDHQTDH